MLSSGELTRSRTQALANAGTVYGLLIQLNALAVNGDQSEVVKRLGELAEILPAEIEAICLILAAERQTANARDLTQRTLAPFFPGKPEEHPDACNDDQPSNPPHPSPDVA